jgi:hypothetical protein
MVEPITQAPPKTMLAEVAVADVTAYETVV